jgi:hypothetical protein
LATPTRRGKIYMKYIGKLDKVLLIKVILLPFDKYNLFHPAKRYSIFLIKPSQIALALKKAPNGRLKYFKGKEETPHPKILAKPSTLMTFLIGTNSNYARLIFKPKTTLKRKNKACK